LDGAELATTWPGWDDSALRLLPDGVGRYLVVRDGAQGYAKRALPDVPLPTGRQTLIPNRKGRINSPSPIHCRSGGLSDRALHGRFPRLFWLAAPKSL